MHPKEWERPQRMPLLVVRGDDGWDLARLAAVARGYVVGYGHLPAYAAMHPTTSAELDLFSNFAWSEILPGASGTCRCVEDPDHRPDLVTLYT